MTSATGFFNGNTYNSVLWNVSGACTLGKHHLGHNPKLAHLIKHDPFCPCGLQGAIERNFGLFLTFVGSVALPLTYWKWKKLDYVVFGLCSFVFTGLMQWALRTANEHKVNAAFEEVFSDTTIKWNMYNNPVVHMGAMKLKEDGDASNEDDYELANCSQTFEHKDYQNVLKKKDGCCPVDKLPKKQIKIIYNYATAAVVRFAASLGEFAGWGNLGVHLLGTDKAGGYYPFEQLSAPTVLDDLEVIVAPDGHTYPKKAYQEEMQLTDKEMKLFPKNKWLAELVKFIFKKNEEQAV